MGSQISRAIHSIRSRRSARRPARTVSDPTPDSSSSAAARSSSSPDLTSYEDAYPYPRSLDSSSFIDSDIIATAIDLESHDSSLDSPGQMPGFLDEVYRNAFEVYFEDKREVWKNPELSDLVDDYYRDLVDDHYDGSLRLPIFCNMLHAGVKRAGHIESRINVALRIFQEEHYGATGEGADRNYSRTLEELSNFRAAGDPFTEEFFRVSTSIYSRKIVMFKRLQAMKQKLDKKLRKQMAWRRVTNVIFIAVFASVLISSVVAAAVSAPPAVTALFAAAAVPLGSMGKWLNSIWKNFERDLRGQSDIISLMQIGSYIVLNDLDSIKRLIERFQIAIAALTTKAEFATRGEEAVVLAMEEIRLQVDSFIKTIQELRDRANKCTEETRMARTSILRKIINHPTSSDIAMFSV